MSDEIVKKEMTPAQARMAKARAARGKKIQNNINPDTGELKDTTIDMAVTRQAKKAPVYEEESAAARTQTRQPRGVRADGRAEVLGRNGEVLSRSRTQVGDIFDIPQSMIPSGWSYQWNAVSIAGNKDILLDQSHMMYLNGWRPVPAERYAGTLVPKDAKGPIIRGQQMLVERPVALTNEAKAEDERNARQLISDRNESLKLGSVKKNLGEGLEMSDRYKGTGGGVRIQIDKSMDVLNVNRESGRYTVDE